MHTDAAITWGRYTIVQPRLRSDLMGVGGIVIDEGSLFIYERSADAVRLVQVLSAGQWRKVGIAE